MDTNPSVVLVVDDDAAVREALDALLRSVGLRVRTYESAEEVLANPLPDEPACIIADVRMHGMSGLEFQSQLSRSGNKLPLIFVTAHADIPMSVRAMKAGAIEFLTKPFRNQDLLDAVQSALKSSQFRRDESAANADLHERFETLSSREREIMALVASGLLNKQVAAELDLSEITVKVHRGSLMKKMRAASLADLVRMADKIGIDATPRTPKS